MGTYLFLELWLVSTWTELRRVALKSLDLCTYYLATSMLLLIRFAASFLLEFSLLNNYLLPYLLQMFRIIVILYSKYVLLFDSQSLDHTGLQIIVRDVPP